ncbi:hypothetical protein A1OS_20930 [Enterovibrio norvegicus]|uniref:hypothetical protein n=1 Tax=Enterovibrio norvegicus TaxID=188144 RepID=UPI0002D48D46|nr:hypothetical protein [Enterovibrio norvegicus]OEE59345.1 hypothetical protein A1OS_20930 [Enterovibrio norvegicus]
MPKRNDHILVLLTSAPWWVSIIFSAVVYVALAFLAPAWLENGSAVGEGLAQTSKELAPFFGIVLIIPAVLSLIRDWLSNYQKRY